mgnify:CR=1 FL=1
MALEMHNISSSTRNKKKTKLGRGDASGFGNYSGRGQKGQKSRSGASGLKWIGMKKRLIAQTPKLRGFKSIYLKNQPVNLKQINESFQQEKEVTPEKLLEFDIISKNGGVAKILGDGELTIKGLTFSGVKVSKSAREQIEKMGGYMVDIK